jgi:hypothetical protein
MQFHARPPSFLVLIQRELFVHAELTGRNSSSTVGARPNTPCHAAVCSKDGNNSGSGVGIICSCKNRPAFSFARPQNRADSFCFLLFQTNFGDSGGPIRALRNPRDHK